MKSKLSDSDFSLELKELSRELCDQQVESVVGGGVFFYSEETGEEIDPKRLNDAGDFVTNILNFETPMAVDLSPVGDFVGGAVDMYNETFGSNEIPVNLM